MQQSALLRSKACWLPRGLAYRFGFLHFVTCTPGQLGLHLAELLDILSNLQVHAATAQTAAHSNKQQEA